MTEFIHNTLANLELLLYWVALPCAAACALAAMLGIKAH